MSKPIKRNLNNPRYQKHLRQQIARLRKELKQAKLENRDLNTSREILHTNCKRLLDNMDRQSEMLYDTADQLNLAEQQLDSANHRLSNATSLEAQAFRRLGEIKNELSQVRRRALYATWTGLLAWTLLLLSSALHFI